MAEALKHFLEVLNALVSMGTGAEKSGLSSSDQELSPEEQAKIKRAYQAFKTRDKIAFVGGVFNIAFTSFLLGATPCLFYLWHTPKAILLISFRFIRYYEVGIHYYLLDFCYYANLMLLIYLWYFPRSDFLFRVCFVFANGPLAWAIVQFRNSLVLHSSDKMTSVFIHLSPALVMWALRWFSAPGLYHWPYLEVPIMSDRVPETFASLVIPAYKPHCLWAGLYYFWIFVVKGKRIQSKGYTTLFGELMDKKSGPIYAACSKVNNVWLQRLVYLLCHQIFCFTTASLCILWWNNFYAHTAFLVSLCLISSYNGANYYMDYFSVKYIYQLERKVNAKSKAF